MWQKQCGKPKIRYMNILCKYVGNHSPSRFHSTYQSPAKFAESRKKSAPIEIERRRAKTNFRSALIPLRHPLSQFAFILPAQTRVWHHLRKCPPPLPPASGKIVNPASKQHESFIWRGWLYSPSRRMKTFQTLRDHARCVYVSLAWFLSGYFSAQREAKLPRKCGAKWNSGQTIENCQCWIYPMIGNGNFAIPSKHISHDLLIEFLTQRAIFYYRHLDFAIGCDAIVSNANAILIPISDIGLFCADGLSSVNTFRRIKMKLRVHRRKLHFLRISINFFFHARHVNEIFREKTKRREFVTNCRPLAKRVYCGAKNWYA